MGRSPLTDGGNAIIDCHFEVIADPEDLDLRLQSVVGVLETGLFLGLCDLLVVGTADGVEQIAANTSQEPGLRRLTLPASSPQSPSRALSSSRISAVFDAPNRSHPSSTTAMA